MENISKLGNGINEAMSKIKILGGDYDPESNLSLQEQLLICESVAESTPVSYKSLEEQDKPNESVSVNGSVHDSYKRSVNFVLTESKRNVITQLEACTYRTSPIKVASLLEELFREWPFQEWTGEQKYWLSVAQKRTPRPIVRVIKLIVKQHVTGATTVKNPAKLFSFLIRKRAVRRRRL